MINVLATHHQRSPAPRRIERNGPSLQRGRHGGLRETPAILALVLLCLSVGPAWAGDAPTLIVASGSDDAAVKSAVEKLELLTGVRVATDRIFAVDDLVALSGYTSLTAGHGEAFTCRGVGLDRAAFDQRLGQAIALIDELEFEGALDALEQLRDDLPCSVAVIEARQLRDVFFFIGLMAAYQGQREMAIDQFSRAAAIKPDVTWDPSYDPNAQQIYLAGKEAALTGEASRLKVIPPTDASAIFVDGKKQGSNEAMELELRPGTHVIHIETGQGVVRATGLVLGPGDALWADPRAVGAALQAGDTDGPVGAAADQMLAAGAARWNASSIYISSRRGVISWQPKGELQRVHRSAQPTGDRLGLRLGGGGLIRAGFWSKRPFGFGAALIEGEVALVRELELTFSAGSGFTSAAPGTLGALVQVAGGLQWAFLGLRIRPFIGLQGAMVLDGEAEGEAALGEVGVPKGGVLLRAGVRIAPQPTKALRLAISASGGWVGRPQIGIALSVGFGVRPRIATGG